MFGNFSKSCYLVCLGLRFNAEQHYECLQSNARTQRTVHQRGGEASDQNVFML